MIIKILYIIVIIGFIVDYSGAILSFNKFITSLFYKRENRLHLFSCSLCLTFWSVLIFTYYNNEDLIISLLYAAVAGYLVQYVSMILFTVRELIIKLNNLLNVR